MIEVPEHDKIELILRMERLIFISPKMFLSPDISSFN